MTDTDPVLAAAGSQRRNRFDRLEWAGAFGDLGTLIPFVVAYISLLGMDPYGVLLAFGLAKIAAGLYYRTPVPVQPMKAIGAVATTQAAQSLTITPAAVYGAGLVTGAIWLALGSSGTADRVARWISRPVAVGIVMGLGFSFMLGGIRMMAQDWIVGGAALAATLLLLSNRRVPAMFLLLAAGAIVALIRNPALVDDLAAIRIDARLPSFALAGMTWKDFAVGAVFLALPQVPLTLGNAVIAITEENNRLFPDRPVGEREIAVSTGIMNLLAPLLGGVPMCHGAGGMAGHVRFGARTGGALIILGTIVVAIAVFFSRSVATIFSMFPPPILGVVLFMTGAQLALGSCDFGRTKNDRFTTLVTAACTIWNVGLAFVLGMVLHHALKRGLVRL
ncbi:MAG: putative sulfate/molybdate transporter [Candidatus Levyibacteriota bacterium]